MLVPTFFLRMKTPLIGEPADSEKLQTRMAFCIRNPSVRQEMKDLAAEEAQGVLTRDLMAGICWKYLMFQV